jgi:hypothetical protein
MVFLIMDNDTLTVYLVIAFILIAFLAFRNVSMHYRLRNLERGFEKSLDDVDEKIDKVSRGVDLDHEV